jgi:hypothetical protein
MFSARNTNLAFCKDPLFGLFASIPQATAVRFPSPEHLLFNFQALSVTSRFPPSMARSQMVKPTKQSKAKTAASTGIANPCTTSTAPATTTEHFEAPVRSNSDFEQTPGATTSATNAAASEPKRKKRGNQGNFHGDELSYLESYMPEFLSLHGSTKAFFNKVVKQYFERFQNTKAAMRIQRRSVCL